MIDKPTPVEIPTGTSTVADASDSVARAESLTHWQLVFREFRRHKLAVIGTFILIFMYTVALMSDFIAPHDPGRIHSGFSYMFPQRIRIFHEGSLTRPFVYGVQSARDPVTLERIFQVDESVQYPLRFFTRTNVEYEFLGLFRSNVKLFSAGEGPMFILCTDRLGRDLFTRIIYGARISLTIGLVGVFLSFVLGIIIGGISGFYGGVVDEIFQRIIEFLISIPQLPLWMALSAVIPLGWPVIRMYFAITVILSVIGWTGLARVVRGKILSLREEEFALAAKAAGAGDMWVIFRHLVPNFMSYILVSITLSIPHMILGETALSFIGLGLQPPAVSWGVLLQGAQQVQVVANYPWLLLPGIAVIITVLCFNFVGDGLRDAADPYSSMT